MSLVEIIKLDIKYFMKNGNKEGLSTLRLLLSELEKEKVSLKIKDVSDLTDEQVYTVVSRQIKKLDKEIEAYVDAGRSTESQEAEKRLLEDYLPEQATEEEIRELANHAVGLVKSGEIKNPMQFLSKELKGKADMKLVAKIAKEVQQELDNGSN